MGKNTLLSSLWQNISIQQVLKKLNNPRFWHDSGLLILANVIVTLLGLIRTPVMTWLLPKEEYGMIAAVSAWMPFLLLLSLSGMDSATYHYVAKKLPWAFFTNISIRTRWSLLSAFGFICLSIYWYLQGQTNYALLFLITGLSFPFSSALTVSASILSAQENFKKLFFYRIFESLVDFTGFIPLALSSWIFSRIVSFYTANQLATIIMQVAYCVWVTKNLHRLSYTPPTPEENQELIRYGKHLTLISGVSVVQARADALLVSALLPLETMADYSIGILVAEQFKRLWMIYTSIRYPRLVRMETSRRIRRIWIEGFVVWGAFIVVLIGVIILSHVVIPLILPSTYKNSIELIDLLSFGFIMGVPGMIIELYFRTEQNPKQQYYMRISAALVNLICPYFLMLSLGVQGAAIGKILANATMSGVGMILFILESKRRLPKQ